MAIGKNGTFCAKKAGKTTVVATYKFGNKTYGVKIKFIVKDRRNIYIRPNDNDVVLGDGLTFITRKMYYQGDTLVAKVRIYNSTGRYVTGVEDYRVRIYDQNVQCLVNTYFNMSLNFNDHEYVDKTLHYGKDLSQANVNFNNVTSVNTITDGTFLY